MTSQHEQNSISEAFCRLNLLYAQLAKCYGVTYAELVIYTAIYNESPCTQADVVNKWGIAKQTISKIVRNLEQQGLVEFSQGSNKKEKLISMTPLGNTKMECLLAKVSDFESGVLAHLTEEELASLSQTMTTFSNAFEAKLKNLTPEHPLA